MPAAVAVGSFIVANAATISMVGTFLSVAGAVTGNKTLSRVGMVMGLAGGVAGLAKEGAFGQATQQWANEIGGTTAAAGQTTAQAISDTAASSSSEVAATGLAEGSGAVAEGVSAGASDGVTAGLADAGGVDWNLAQSGTDAASAGAQGGGLMSNAGSSFTDKMLPAVSDYMKSPMDLSGAAGAATETVSGGASLFDKAGALVKGNKELFEVGLKGVSALFQDDEAKDQALKASAQANEASARFTDARTAQLNSQMQNANSIPDITNLFKVNQNAIARTPRQQNIGIPGGLIQSR